MPDQDYAVGFDIGGTKCAVALGRLDEKEGIVLVGRVSFPTETGRGPSDVIGGLIRSMRGLIGDHNLSPARLRGVGVSCGGPLDSARGVILSPPNLPGWDEVPIVDLIRDETGLQAYVQNDANACALAEWLFGAGRGTRNMIFCTFGTGFGAGLIVDGRLYEGANGMAGEIGHVRLAPDGPVGYGKHGSVEGFCSGGGLARMARERARAAWCLGREVAFCGDPADLEQLDARTVAEAALGGDPLALDVFKESGRRLGQALAVLIDVLNPEIIVIGGIFARQRDLLWPEAARVIAAEALEISASVCRVVPAGLGESIGDYASLAIACYHDAQKQDGRT